MYVMLIVISDDATLLRQHVVCLTILIKKPFEKSAATDNIYIYFLTSVTTGCQNHNEIRLLITYLLLHMALTINSNNFFTQN